jgi:hypothetical protein
MPYVIKHKHKDRYVCGTHSKKADHDADELVSLEFARIFPTESGARTALRSWASRWDGLAIDKKKMAWLRRYSNYSEEVIRLSCTGTVVADQAKLDMVEIVPIRIGA